MICNLLSEILTRIIQFLSAMKGTIWMLKVPSYTITFFTENVMHISLTKFSTIGISIESNYSFIL